jgi:dimethylhistidine N-methyltransferase
LPAIAADVGVAARVIEPASSVDIRTKRLLRALDRPAIYVGIDLARAPLERGADALQCQHSDMDVHAVVADFTHSFALPPVRRTFGKTLVFCPGSTIDTFEPHDAVAFLGGLLRIAGPNARLLLGADGTREPSALMHAYDDDDGVTAEFDLDVLSRLNSTHGAQFDPRAFEHRAVWNDTYARVELHLVSKHDQTVRVRGEDVRFRAGEPLVTEHLYKHTPHAMRGILHAAGWQVRQVFTASEQPVRLWLCEPG